ncbi:MAG: 50S ribosomal protein L9 [bacterium]
MKVILKKDFESLGDSGTIVEVKSGYARNFLFPQGIGVIANKKNMRIFQEEQKRKEYQENREKRQAEELAKKLDNVSLTATVKVGEEDKVFGSITSQDIATLLKEKGYEIDKRKIELEDPIKALGVYSVVIKLHSEVEAKIRLWVVKE